MDRDEVSVRVLLLGGTGEARRLAERLVAVPNIAAISSLAGRVSRPVLPAGAVRIGGFGGVAGLSAWLRAERIDAVVDATHPFAATITAAAERATTDLGLPFVVLRRPGWQPEPGDNWHWADDLAEAVKLLPALGNRVFLTTGRSTVAAFAELSQSWFLLRSVEQPQPPLPSQLTVLLARGPYTVDGELALLRTHRIEVLVSKDSGGTQTAAKLLAARTLGLPVLLIRRPPLPAATVLDSEQAVLDWLANLRA